MTGPSPRPGDFAVCHMRGDVGVLIRVGQWLNGDGFRDFEHAFVLVADGEIVEAQLGGAKVARLAEHNPVGVRWSSGRVVLTDEQRAAVVAAARSFIGVPYGWRDLLALALWRFRLRLPWARNVMASRSSMVCSQLVVAAFEDAGVELFPGREPGDVTPGDLAALIGA